MQRRGQWIVSHSAGLVGSLQCSTWVYENDKVEVNGYNENDPLVGFAAEFAKTDDASKKLELPLLSVAVDTFTTWLKGGELTLGFTGLFDDTVKSVDVLHKEAPVVTLRRLGPNEASAVGVTFVDRYYYHRTVGTSVVTLTTLPLTTVQSVRELN